MVPTPLSIVFLPPWSSSPMKLLSASLAAVAALICLCLTAPAEANGRAGPAVQSFAAPVLHQQTAARTSRHTRTRLAWAPRQYAPDWRHGAPAIAVQAAWGDGSRFANYVASYIGMPKFTPYSGPWCADSISAWLRGVGKPPLASRFAGAALSYGAPGDGSPGNLAVFMGRHGAYHVGVVIAERGSMVEVVAGNSVSWGHRVGVSWLPRNSLVYRRT
jgi:hypothetical protein